MLSFLFCLSTVCPAEPTVADDTATVEDAQIQVRDVRQRIIDQSSRLVAIEHYISDQQRAADGHAPKGWVQPPMSDYMAPGAPDSFIPLPPPPVVTVTVVRIPVETTLSSQGPTQ